MSADMKKGYGSTLLLLLFGVLTLYGGVRWLPLLVPAAAAVWYGTSRLLLRRHKNSD